MAKGIFRISFLLLSSLTLFFLSSDDSQSCGWDSEGDDYYSLFNVKLINQPSLEPFFLSDYMYHPYEDSSFFDGKKLNLKEWKKYFGDGVEINDIEKVLYPAKKDEIIILKNAIITNNNLLIKEKWRNNSLVKFWIKNKEDKSLDYFIYAKEIEPLVEEYYWEVPKRDTSLMLSLIDEGVSRYKQTDNNFLKLRYAFQAIRLSHYTNNFENTVKFYDELVENLNEESIVKYWALSLKAGALKKLGRTAEANYYFAVVFKNCPERRFIASNSLNVSFKDSLLYESLKYCKNNDERAALWFLSEFKGPTIALDAMKNIYELNPKSPYLELLLNREVIRVEREVLPSTDYYWSGYKDYLKRNDYIEQDLNEKITALVKSIATEKKTLHPYVWYLAAGYLMTLNNENHGAPTFYYYAKDSWPRTDTLNRKNIRLFETTNDIIGLSSVYAESSILKNMVWLQNNNEAAFLFARQKLARLYAGQFDIVRTHLLLGDEHFNYNLTSSPKEEPIDNLITFLEKPAKTEYEKFLEEIYKYSVKDLYDIKGTIYLSQHRFIDALEAFRKGNGGEVLQADPFTTHIKDCIDCDIRDKTSKRYSKKDFTLRILKLDSLAKIDENNAAHYYYLLGNGLYNATLYGNCWGAVSYYKDFDFGGYNKDKDWELYDCSRAQVYYLKAMGLSDDNEFKARCCFMAAKCEQNTFYMDLGAGKIKIDEKNFWKNYSQEKLKYRNNFKILFDKYSDTEFYKEAIKECKYFNEFVKLNY